MAQKSNGRGGDDERVALELIELRRENEALRESESRCRRRVRELEDALYRLLQLLPPLIAMTDREFGVEP